MYLDIQHTPRLLNVLYRVSGFNWRSKRIPGRILLILFTVWLSDLSTYLRRPVSSRRYCPTSYVTSTSNNISLYILSVSIDFRQIFSSGRTIRHIHCVSYDRSSIGYAVKCLWSPRSCSAVIKYPICQVTSKERKGGEGGTIYGGLLRTSVHCLTIWNLRKLYNRPFLELAAVCMTYDSSSSWVS